MKRYWFLLYGVCSHLLFLVTYAVLACFVANLFLPKTIDTPSGDSIGKALTINVLLMVIFGLQHSVMARPWFKRLWTRVVPEPIERATYGYFASLATLLLMWQWRGIDVVVWDVAHPAVRQVVWGLFALGWLMVPAVSLMINHFDLFGTRQVWLYFQGKDYTSLPFRTPMLYQSVRHPLYVSWTLAFWAIPTMTLGHLLFAIVLTGYMGLAVIWEERDLVAYFGQTYEDYRRRVPMFWPRWNSPSEASSPLGEVAEQPSSPSLHDSFHA
jgi:methanethiol S-methyltransferase